MSGSNNLYRCTPRQVRGHIIDCLYAGLVPFVKSSPGLGKSAINRSVCDELNLKMIDHRLSGADPTDFSGLPSFKDGFARYSPFEDLFPLENAEPPPGKDGWMLFLDEMNSAPKAVLAASYKLILDRMVGQANLHPNVVLSCAGNLDTDRAITNPIGTALQSRVVHIEMEANFKEWLEDVALVENYDWRVIAYLSMYESKLMDFRPDHNDRTFCCPRTWEFMDRLVRSKEPSSDKTSLYAGTITSGVAVEFVQFCAVVQNLVKVPEILADPEGCRLPSSPELKWATITQMMEKVDATNIEKLSTYANRFDLSFRILFYRSVLVKHTGLKRHPAVINAQLELARYLND